MELENAREGLEELLLLFENPEKSSVDNVVFGTFTFLRNAHAQAQVLLLEGRFAEVQRCLELCRAAFVHTVFSPLFQGTSPAEDSYRLARLPLRLPESHATPEGSGTVPISSSEECPKDSVPGKAKRKPKDGMQNEDGGVGKNWSKDPFQVDQPTPPVPLPFASGVSCDSTVGASLKPTRPHHVGPTFNSTAGASMATPLPSAMTTNASYSPKLEKRELHSTTMGPSCCTMSDSRPLPVVHGHHPPGWTVKTKQQETIGEKTKGEEKGKDEERGREERCVVSTENVTLPFPSSVLAHGPPSSLLTATSDDMEALPQSTGKDGAPLAHTGRHHESGSKSSSSNTSSSSSSRTSSRNGGKTSRSHRGGSIPPPRHKGKMGGRNGFSEKRSLKGIMRQHLRRGSTAAHVRKSVRFARSPARKRMINDTSHHSSQKDGRHHVEEKKNTKKKKEGPSPSPRSQKERQKTSSPSSSFAQGRRLRGTKRPKRAPTTGLPTAPTSTLAASLQHHQKDGEMGYETSGTRSQSKSSVRGTEGMSYSSEIVVSNHSAKPTLPSSSSSVSTADMREQMKGGEQDVGTEGVGLVHHGEPNASDVQGLLFSSPAPLPSPPACPAMSSWTAPSFPVGATTERRLSSLTGTSFPFSDEKYTTLSSKHGVSSLAFSSSSTPPLCLLFSEEDVELLEKMRNRTLQLQRQFELAQAIRPGRNTQYYIKKMRLLQQERAPQQPSRTGIVEGTTGNRRSPLPLEGPPPFFTSTGSGGMERSNGVALSSSSLLPEPLSPPERGVAIGHRANINQYRILHALPPLVTWSTPFFPSYAEEEENEKKKRKGLSPSPPSSHGAREEEDDAGAKDVRTLYLSCRDLRVIDAAWYQEVASEEAMMEKKKQQQERKEKEEEEQDDLYERITKCKSRTVANICATLEQKKTVTVREEVPQAPLTPLYLKAADPGFPLFSSEDEERISDESFPTVLLPVEHPKRESVAHPSLSVTDIKNTKRQETKTADGDEAERERVEEEEVVAVLPHEEDEEDHTPVTVCQTKGKDRAFLPQEDKEEVGEWSEEEKPHWDPVPAGRSGGWEDHQKKRTRRELKGNEDGEEGNEEGPLVDPVRPDSSCIKDCDSILTSGGPDPRRTSSPHHTRTRRRKKDCTQARSPSLSSSSLSRVSFSSFSRSTTSIPTGKMQRKASRSPLLIPKTHHKKAKQKGKGERWNRRYPGMAPMFVPLPKILLPDRKKHIYGITRRSLTESFTLMRAHRSPSTGLIPYQDEEGSQERASLSPPRPVPTAQATAPSSSPSLSSCLLANKKAYNVTRAIGSRSAARAHRSFRADGQRPLSAAEGSEEGVGASGMDKHTSHVMPLFSGTQGRIRSSPQASDIEEGRPSTRGGQPLTTLSLLEEEEEALTEWITQRSLQCVKRAKRQLGVGSPLVQGSAVKTSETPQPAVPITSSPSTDVRTEQVVTEGVAVPLTDVGTAEELIERQETAITTVEEVASSSSPSEASVPCPPRTPYGGDGPSHSSTLPPLSSTSSSLPPVTPPSALEGLPVVPSSSFRNISVSSLPHLRRRLSPLPATTMAAREEKVKTSCSPSPYLSEFFSRMKEESATAAVSSPNASISFVSSFYERWMEERLRRGTCWPHHATEEKDEIMNDCLQLLKRNQLERELKKKDKGKRLSEDPDACPCRSFLVSQNRVLHEDSEGEEQALQVEQIQQTRTGTGRSPQQRPSFLQHFYTAYYLPPQDFISKTGQTISPGAILESIFRRHGKKEGRTRKSPSKEKKNTEQQDVEAAAGKGKTEGTPTFLANSASPSLLEGSPSPPWKGNENVDKGREGRSGVGCASFPPLPLMPPGEDSTSISSRVMGEVEERNIHRGKGATEEKEESLPHVKDALHDPSPSPLSMVFPLPESHGKGKTQEEKRTRQPVPVPPPASVWSGLDRHHLSTWSTTRGYLGPSSPPFSFSLEGDDGAREEWFWEEKPITGSSDASLTDPLLFYSPRARRPTGVMELTGEETEEEKGKDEEEKQKRKWIHHALPSSSPFYGTLVVAPWRVTAAVLVLQRAWRRYRDAYRAGIPPRYPYSQHRQDGPHPDTRTRAAMRTSSKVHTKTGSRPPREDPNGAGVDGSPGGLSPPLLSPLPTSSSSVLPSPSSPFPRPPADRPSEFSPVYHNATLHSPSGSSRTSTEKVSVTPHLWLPSPPLPSRMAVREGEMEVVDTVGVAGRGKEMQGPEALCIFSFSKSGLSYPTEHEGEEKTVVLPRTLLADTSTCHSPPSTSPFRMPAEGSPNTAAVEKADVMEKRREGTLRHLQVKRAARQIALWWWSKRRANATPPHEKTMLPSAFPPLTTVIPTYEKEEVKGEEEEEEEEEKGVHEVGAEDRPEERPEAPYTSSSSSTTTSSSSGSTSASTSSSSSADRHSSSSESFHEGDDEEEGWLYHNSTQEWSSHSTSSASSSGGSSSGNTPPLASQEDVMVASDTPLQDLRQTRAMILWLTGKASEKEEKLLFHKDRKVKNSLQENDEEA